ncbi:MAG: Ferredoxin subunit of nitrite reductase and ring-hydroxylating dioxygenase-like protein [Actinomycetia bacterium]|nr:Ferredoxin subunit of nitrite reductase and ring-hydroxylating dioxygenase-like protein [Actinomycetes bacterium]
MAAVAGCASGAAGSATAPTTPGAAPAKAKVLAKTSDIPVGGGKIFSDAQVVVTQPAAGTFKAFTAVCPHQGCTVASVASGKIICPCHGSQFQTSDGSVVQGPASTPLTEVPIKVTGGSITLA